MQKCQLILKVRKTQNLKYGDIILPLEPDKIHGYHMSCYRKFTALSKAQRLKKEAAEKLLSTEVAPNQTVSSSSEMNSTRRTRSEITSPRPSLRTGIVPNVCLFCDQTRKKVKGMEQKLVSALTKDFEKNIRGFIRLLNDEKLERRLEGTDFIAKEVKYHNCCRLQYQSRAEARGRSFDVSKTKSISSGTWHLQREVHKKAFEALCCYIDEIIIKNKEVMHTADLNN